MDNEITPEVEGLRVATGADAPENFIFGGVAGLVAALVGAAIWAAVTYYTSYQIGYMALGIGYLVGVVMFRFGHGRSQSFGVLAAVLALCGCILGNLFSACAFAADQLNVPMMKIVETLTPSVAIEILQEGFSAIDALFYLLAVSAAYRASKTSE
jgi:uncharacterized membrane protein